MPVGALGLINHNVRGFSGAVRFVARQDGQAAGTVSRLIVDTQLETTNFDLPFSRVQNDPATPGPYDNLPTVTADPWTARYGFPTPASSPTTETGAQAFALWARLIDSGTSGTTIKADLYENGNFRADLGTRTITERGGQFLVYSWSASDLTNATGADVEIKLTGVSLDGDYSGLGAVSWDAELTAWPYSSGWIDAPLGALEEGYRTEEPPRRTPFVPPSEWSIQYVRVQIRDDQAQSERSPLAVIEAPAIENYVQAGVFVAAEAISPTHGARFGSSYKGRARRIASGSLGDHAYAFDAYQQNIEQLEFLLSRAESQDFRRRLDRFKGKTKPVLLIRDPDGSQESQQLSAMWATLADLPAHVSNPSDLETSPGAYSATYIFEEAL